MIHERIGCAICLCGAEGIANESTVNEIHALASAMFLILAGIFDLFASFFQLFVDCFSVTSHA